MAQAETVRLVAQTGHSFKIAHNDASSNGQIIIKDNAERANACTSFHAEGAPPR